MPEADPKRAAFRALVDRVLAGPGRASRAERARAFDNAASDNPDVAALIDKVATRPARITDADVTAAQASGCGEDELFELVVCAAVGRSERLYQAGLAALAEAVADEAGR